MMAKSSDKPAHVYELAKQTNPFLQKCIEIARTYFIERNPE